MQTVSNNCIGVIVINVTKAKIKQNINVFPNFKLFLAYIYFKFPNLKYQYSYYLFFHNGEKKARVR